jgi:DNA invertase Pin-like site-specific DNA recombinase
MSPRPISSPKGRSLRIEPEVTRASQRVPQNPAIYLRISDDRQGLELGVDRQLKEDQEKAAQLGWKVREEHIYSDPDTSAFTGVYRPAYEAMLAAIEAGEVDGVITWATDRLYRRPQDLERFIGIIDKARIPVQVVQAGEIDISTPFGRAAVRMGVIMNSYESEIKAVRQKAKHRELKENGQPAGGKRPFGLSDVVHENGSTRRELVPEEAALIRKAAQDIIGGKAVRAVCRELDAAGVRTSGGSEWQPIVLTRILASDWVVGKRGEFEAKWPAILDEDTQRLVVALLASRARGKSYPRHLLSGVAQCGVCGGRLVSRPSADKQPSYVCASSAGGCGKIRVRAHPLEEYVIEMARSRYPEFLIDDSPVDDTTTAAKAQLEAARARKLQLARWAEDGTMDEEEFVEAKKANDKRIRDLNAALDGTAMTLEQQRKRKRLVDQWEKLPTMTGDGLAALGENERRGLRDMVAATVAVVIKPARPGYNRFDPNRVDFAPLSS